jgi:hypothetical protein
MLAPYYQLNYYARYIGLVEIVLNLKGPRFDSDAIAQSARAEAGKPLPKVRSGG